MRICLYPSDRDGVGCYRLLFPGRMLREKGGHEALMAPYTETVQEDGHRVVALNLHTPPDADVYVFQRKIEASVPPAMRALQKLGKKVVCDVDDWFLGLPGTHPAIVGLRTYERSFGVADDGRMAVRRTRRHGNRDNLHDGFKTADILTCSTPFLADEYGRYGETVVLPNYLDWEMWEHVELQCEVERERVRVGYMGTARFHSHDLGLLRGLIGPWLRRNPNVDFVASGDESIHELLDVPEGQRVSYPHIDFQEFRLPEIVAVMDIGLVPLEDSRFNEAKSHLKGMEYAACGIPCIASPSASYREWVEDSANGLLARRPHDWLRCLDLLVNDEDLRRTMGRAARLKAERNTIQEHWPRWEQTYGALLGAEAVAA